jgi:hypothetical protein
MSGWLVQNYDPSPNIGLVLLGFGLLIPLGLIGVYAGRRRQIAWFLMAWAVIQFITLYLPVGFQRRLINGLHLPIALLAAYAIILFRRQYSMFIWRLALTLGLISVISITNLQNLLSDIFINFAPAQAGYQIYLSRPEAEMITWLKNHTTLSAVVLSNPWIGNSTAGLAARTVVIGHGHQTVNYLGRSQEWNRFRTGQMSAVELSNWLTEHRVDLLFWTPADQLAGGYQPDSDDRWLRQHQIDDVKLYQLQRH